MRRSLLVLKKSLKKYDKLLKAFGGHSIAAVQQFDRLLQDMSGPQEGSGTVAGPTVTAAKNAISTMFGTRLVGSESAVHAADVSMYNLLALTSLRPKTIVLNGMNEHGAVASASTAREGSFAGAQRMFEAPFGFLDRHGLVRRDLRGVAHLFPSRALWRIGQDGAPELDRLERDVYRIETERVEKSVINSEHRDKLPIPPEAKMALLDYMRRYSPIAFDEFESKLNGGQYNEAELTKLVAQATTKHNNEIKDSIFTTPEGREAVAKHYLLPHLYFYPQEKDDPLPSIFDAKKNSNGLFFDADKKILVKNPYSPYAIYHAFSNIPDLQTSPFKSLLTYFRPNPLFSHYFINKNISQDQNNAGFKSSVAHSYSPYLFDPDHPDRVYDGQLVLKTEWEKILGSIPSAGTVEPWDQEKAMGLARDLFVKSRRQYSQDVLNSSFKKIADRLGYGNASETKFAPYDRYIMPSSSDAQVPSGTRSLSLLSVAKEIFNKVRSTVPWQGMYQFRALPQPDRNGSPSWFVNPPNMIVGEDGIAFPQFPRQGSSFINQKIATGATDLSMNTGLTKVRGWPYQWRSINNQQDLADGDEHALILDILRALHQSGKNWSDIDAHYDLIHKTLVGYRSASGFSSHHRLVNDIARLYSLNFNATKDNVAAVEALINADKPVAPNGNDFFSHFAKAALEKRKEYLDTIDAWKTKNEKRGALEKDPLPQVENRLYHELSTLVADDDVAKKIGKRIDAQSKEHEKYISGTLATSGASSTTNKASEKSHFFRTYIHPFIKSVMQIHGSRLNIPGTSIEIPETYEDQKWGADDTERKYHQDVVFHLAHHLMKTIVGNETCHWCDGHGIVRTEDLRLPSYCTHCNEGKSPDDELFRQIHIPEIDEETRKTLSEQRRTVPAWDIAQMGTYANNSGASQLTPRLLENFDRLLKLHSGAVKGIIQHDVVKTMIDDFINNPKKYVPVSTDAEHPHPGDPLPLDPSPAPSVVPPVTGPSVVPPVAATAPAGVRLGRRTAAVSAAGAAAPPSGPEVPPSTPEKISFEHYID